MTGLVLALVVFSSFLHAGWNYLAKTIPNGAAFVWLLAVVMSVLLLPLAAAYVWWYGFDWTPLNAAALLTTGVLHLVYFLVLQQGYAAADLSVVYPLARGSGPVFTTLGAVVLLGESVTAGSLAALGLVAAGVLLIAGSGRAGADAERRRKGLWYGLGTGLLIASYTVFDGYAVRQLAIAPIMLEACSHPLRVLALTPVAVRRWPEVRSIWQGHRWKVLVIAAVSPLAFLLVLYAMRQAPVHVVAPTRELSIVFGVIFGAKLLTEENFLPRLLGSLLILAGIVFLSLRP